MKVRDMLPKSKVTFDQVERKRREYAAILRDFVKLRGRAKYHNLAPELPQLKLDGCEVIQSRLSLLDRLPKGGVIAELGAQTGEFSHTIMEHCAPSMLHLLGVDGDQLTHTGVRAELSAPPPASSPILVMRKSVLPSFPITSLISSTSTAIMIMTPYSATSPWLHLRSNRPGGWCCMPIPHGPPYRCIIAGWPVPCMNFA